MKTLIFNGSARKNGETQSMIDALTAQLEGEYKVVNAHSCNVRACVDCRYCWEHPACSIQDGWQEIDSKWYYFGSKSKGYMYKNAWIKEKGKNTYYVGSDGSRCTGWYTGKNTYYFDKKGRLVTGSASCQCKHHQDHDSGSGGRKL